MLQSFIGPIANLAGSWLDAKSQAQAASAKLKLTEAEAKAKGISHLASSFGFGFGSSFRFDFPWRRPHEPKQMARHYFYFLHCMCCFC